MDGIVTKLEDGRLFIKLNTSIYEKEAVMAAAYKMTDSCFIIIKPLDNTLVGIFFESKNNQDERELEEIAKKFCNEVLDQQVRLDVEKRYGNIRDLLIMQAFRPIENIGDKIKA
ncbi:MAG: His-Xaa-Ser system protein HxsD [Planctomycetes bacterium RIFCSPHIGHO2_02_FULL_50_42]|nr:MAG: His-Xaa-Ser system protein HxsD [Planctomycetes bacterium RIFCSPHIGHO2_02_FULL_50_42]OHB91570.1 MAG: His-Xaa-Ser system protein HxsD [Planctomycetes bacterium RIFCSPHIGHO2_12_FULL_51_37]OHB96517.1 MAG: His-Xaa-Ser system protein HxsD [Planctomycetes bacterium RIFCSPLOWO2_02_FULL_50_16]